MKSFQDMISAAKEERGKLESEAAQKLEEQRIAKQHQIEAEWRAFILSQVAIESQILLRSNAVMSYFRYIYSEYPREAGRFEVQPNRWFGKKRERKLIKFSESFIELMPPSLKTNSGYFSAVLRGDRYSFVLFAGVPKRNSQAAMQIGYLHGWYDYPCDDTVYHIERKSFKSVDSLFENLVKHFEANETLLIKSGGWLGLVSGELRRFLRDLDF